MAKMLGRKGVGQCPWCRCTPEGPSDCPDTSKSNRQVRFAEERAWRREAERELADEREAIVQAEREAEYERQIHSHWAYRLLEGN